MIEPEYYLIRSDNKYVQRKKYLENIKYKAYLFFTANDGANYIKYIGEFGYSNNVIANIINYNDKTIGFFPKEAKIYMKFPYEIDGINFDDIDLRITDKYIRNNASYIKCPCNPQTLDFLGSWLYERANLYDLLKRRVNLVWNGLNRSRGELYTLYGNLFMELFKLNKYDDTTYKPNSTEYIIYDEKPHIYHVCNRNWFGPYKEDEDFAYIYFNELYLYLDDIKYVEYRYRICKKQEQE